MRWSTKIKNMRYAGSLTCGGLAVAWRKRRREGRRKKRSIARPGCPSALKKLGDFKFFYSPLPIPPEGLKVNRVGQQFEVHLIPLPPHLTIGKLDEMKSVISIMAFLN